MSKLKIKEATTSKLARIFVQDSSSTTGAGLAGLVYNSASLTAYWIAEGDATATSITLATMTAGTWASGGFKEVDATNMPGVYEVGLPNVVVDATSEGSVVVMLKGATNMAPVLLELELDGIDYTVAHATQAQIGTAGAGLTDITINAASVDAIWDEVITKAAHNVSNSAAKFLRLIKQATSVTESAVDDPLAAATTTVFNTDLTEVDDFWNDCVLVFTTGSLVGQSKPIQNFANTNGVITLDEALTAAPADNDEFVIVSLHVHPISQIQSGLATSSEVTALNNQLPSEAF